jgi:soluble lytic murein transglycosylase-like protein
MSTAAQKIPVDEQPSPESPPARPRRTRRPKAVPPDLVKRARARLRKLARGLGRSWRLRLLKWALVLSAPVWLINVAVAFFGQSVVFPLSPFFLREKVAALGKYALHRPLCWLAEHPDTGPLAARAEVRYHLPRGLLAAIIHVESGGKAHRISSAGAMGVGQLMPDTARRLGVGDPFDTVANVDGAARLMAQHLARFHNTRLAIAAYHAGPSAVRNGVPQNGMTPDYVARVMRVYAANNPRRARLTLAR